MENINHRDMKRNIRNIIAALAAIVCLTACGNAGAKDKKDKDSGTKNVIVLDAAQFNAKVYDLSKEGLAYLGDKPAIVDFYATWCGPCQRISPILEELAGEYKDKIVVYKIDVDKAGEVAQTFNVSSIPAILYIPADGEEPVMTIGSRDKATFKKEIDTILLGK